MPEGFVRQPGNETPLQMTQRHVDEGRARITRQEALIARLRQAGHENMLHKANELLCEMREFQGSAEAHLAREVAKVTRLDQSERGSGIE